MLMLKICVLALVAITFVSGFPANEEATSASPEAGRSVPQAAAPSVSDLKSPTIGLFAAPLLGLPARHELGPHGTFTQVLVSSPDSPPKSDVYAWKWSPTGQSLYVAFVRNADTGSLEYEQRACPLISEADVSTTLRSAIDRVGKTVDVLRISGASPAGRALLGANFGDRANCLECTSKKHDLPQGFCEDCEKRAMALLEKSDTWDSVKVQGSLLPKYKASVVVKEYEGATLSAQEVWGAVLELPADTSGNHRLTYLPIQDANRQFRTYIPTGSSTEVPAFHFHGFRGHRNQIMVSPFNAAQQWVQMNRGGTQKCHDFFFWSWTAGDRKSGKPATLEVWPSEGNVYNIPTSEVLAVFDYEILDILHQEEYDRIESQPPPRGSGWLQRAATSTLNVDQGQRRTDVSSIVPEA